MHLASLFTLQSAHLTFATELQEFLIDLVLQLLTRLMTCRCFLSFRSRLVVSSFVLQKSVSLRESYLVFSCLGFGCHIQNIILRTMARSFMALVFFSQNDLLIYFGEGCMLTIVLKSWSTVSWLHCLWALLEAEVMAERTYYCGLIGMAPKDSLL